MALLWFTYGSLSLVLLVFGLRGAFRAWLDRKARSAVHKAYIEDTEFASWHEERERRIARKEELLRR